MGLFSFRKKKSTSKSSSQTTSSPNIDDLPPIPVPDSSNAMISPAPSSTELVETGDMSSTPVNASTSSDSEETIQVSPTGDATGLTAQQVNEEEDVIEEQTEDNAASATSQSTSSSSQDLPRFKKTPVEVPSHSLNEDGEPIFQESEFDFHNLFVEQERYIKAITDLKRTKHDFERRFAENTEDFIKPNEKTGRLLKKMKTKFMACNKNLLTIDTKLANQKL